MDRLFHLKVSGAHISSEILCGMTTFLTMSYILFVNPTILAQSGMPYAGAFVATALSAALCSFIMGFAANTPFAMAPGMGLNTFFTYVVCLNMGFHWKEGLALFFVTGLLHLLIMVTGIRRSLVNAIPHHLKIAFGVGLGLFIAYVGVKSGNLLEFTTPPGHSRILDNGTVISSASTIPSFVNNFGAPQLICLLGLTVMLVLLALEKKTGERYGALPIGILTATFVGIPLGVTNIVGARFFDLGGMGEIKEVFFSFWGTPGIMSIISDPERMLLSCLIILVVLSTNIVDSIGTIIGIGQTRRTEILTAVEMGELHSQRRFSRLDRSLVCNALGGSIGALFGTSVCTTYMESITGIVAGGRTGLTAIVAGCLFLFCLPLSSFFSMIPASAVAPALIVAGAFMLPLVASIDWSNFEESFPAFVTIMGIPLTYGFVHGIAAGVLSHLVIQITLGKWRDVHPTLYCIGGIFILVISAEVWM